MRAALVRYDNVIDYSHDNERRGKGGQVYRMNIKQSSTQIK